MLRKVESGSNMYDFCTHTYNVIKGKCAHNCVYCYMKIYKLNDIRFDKKALDIDLGKDNMIFVGSSTDMWAVDVSDQAIDRILDKCKQHDNTYLFQSKNPERFVKFVLPPKVVLATTIESNRDYPEISLAPKIEDRILHMAFFSSMKYTTMITIEPILDFDLDDLVRKIKFAKPTWVNIGADSKGHNLPEPSDRKKLGALINELNSFTQVRRKSNLERLFR